MIGRTCGNTLVSTKRPSTYVLELHIRYIACLRSMYELKAHLFKSMHEQSQRIYTLTGTHKNCGDGSTFKKVTGYIEGKSG